MRLRPVRHRAQRGGARVRRARRRARAARRGRARPLPRRRRRGRARGHARAAAVRGRGRARRHGPGGARRPRARGDREWTAPGCAPRRRARRPSARCGAPSTRRAARSRPPRSRTASSPPVASYRDLGAFQLLLSLQDDDALRLYCDSVLGPLEDASGEYGDELIRSLEAFIEQNGQWEQAARELFCHRHTLRYRIRRVEQLTGPRPVERPRPNRVLARAAGPGAGDYEEGGVHSE